MLQPWKLTTLAIGLALLIAGAQVYQICDWDIGVSLVMGLLTYIFAPLTVRIFWFRNWKAVPYALLAMWLAVDGCYVAYHTLVGNEMLRGANAACSSFIYLFCGVIWSWNGSLRELLEEVKQAFRGALL